MPSDNSSSGAFHGIQSGMEWTSGAIVGKLMATPVWELSWIDGAAAGSLTELCPKVSVSFSCRIESLIRQTKPREGGRRSGLQPTEPPSPKPAHAPFLLGSVLYARSARQTLQVPMELNSDLLDLAIAKKIEKRAFAIRFLLARYCGSFGVACLFYIYASHVRCSDKHSRRLCVPHWATGS